ncbi:MAG: FAD-binding oxidoreductase [Proteobacteria bacterium]|nr:FAD-binding oxidoreductase [Pseudomonadota bacterium]
MRSTIKGLLRTAKGSQNTIDRLRGKYDLPSVGEFLTAHVNDFERGRDIKGKFTSDPKTTEVAQSVFASKSTKKHLTFFEDKIFSQPPHSTQETGSIKVKISDIRDFPKYTRDFEAEKNKEAMICVGGPAAEDQVVMSKIVSGVRERLTDVIYLTRDYKESNVNHSAKQSHARHGNALNADETLTGHALLPILVTRQLLGTDLEEVLDSDYKKIDVKFTIDPKKLRIYFGNELNWLKQEYKKLNGQLTEHDINRMESVLSQEIMRVVEKEAGLEISGGVERSIEDSASIHVTFTEKNSEEVEHENESFKRVGINPEKLTREEINFFFESEEIQSAWKYPGDTHVKFDDHETNRKFAESQGATWLEGKEVDRIMLAKNKDGKARIAGVMTKDGKYFYADKLHFTGGYKVDYEFDRDAPTRFLSGSRLRNLVNKVEDAFGLQKPLNNNITTATGVSINAVFKKTDRIKRIIEKYGSTGEIAITNSHWTMIAQNDDHVVMRITGGGNTGSEEYNPTYFLNTIANTRRIFGDDLIGILSTYGCPRAVNARNSTEFAKIAEGGIISYGKGGTGNTKRHAEAAMGLMMLGFEEEVVDYFNKFQGRKGQPLGDELKEIYQHIKDVKFLHDNVQKTNRRMGYDKSLSAEEMMAVGLVLAAASYALYKSLQKGKDKDQNGDLPKSSGIKAIGSSNLTYSLINIEQQKQR